MAGERRWTDYMPLSEVLRAPRNPKRHRDDLIEGSVDRFGVVEQPTIDERTGRLVAGHGRLDDLERRRAAGQNPPSGIDLRDDGEWLIPVSRGWASRSDADAEAYVVISNESTIRGGYDTDLLAESLAAIRDADPNLLALTGYDDDSVEHLLMLGQKAGADGEQATAKAGSVGVPRVGSSVDGIFTIRPDHPLCWFADSIGLKIGVISKGKTAKSAEKWPWKFPCTFIDNDWHDYDHTQHADVVAAFRPKYATVRDLMTREQCRDAGVAYYSVDKIVEWAYELAGHATNVILIPKFDCIAEIPPQFMLGYSVPSSYGATPLSVDAFRGRRTHLLGGPWRVQRAYLQMLGDDVVSLDFNHCFNAARFGGFMDRDGKERNLTEHFGQRPAGGMLIACALSLGNIAADLHDITGGESGAEADPELGAPDDTEATADRDHQVAEPVTAS